MDSSLTPAPLQHTMQHECSSTRSGVQSRPTVRQLEMRSQRQKIFPASPERSPLTQIETPRSPCTCYGSKRMVNSRYNSNVPVINKLHLSPTVAINLRSRRDESISHSCSRG